MANNDLNDVTNNEQSPSAGTNIMLLAVALTDDTSWLFFGYGNGEKQ